MNLWRYPKGNCWNVQCGPWPTTLGVHDATIPCDCWSRLSVGGISQEIGQSAQFRYQFYAVLACISFPPMVIYSDKNDQWAVWVSILQSTSWVVLQSLHLLQVNCSVLSWFIMVFNFFIFYFSDRIRTQRHVWACGHGASSRSGLSRTLLSC